MEVPSALELNPEVVNHRTETYSSLTDIYGIPIFSDDLEQKIREYQDEQAIQREKTESELFVKAMVGTASDYEQVKEQLFMQSQGLVLKNNTAIVQTSPFMPITILGIMTAIFAVSLIKIITQRKKKRIKNYADSNNRGESTRG